MKQKFTIGHEYISRQPEGSQYLVFTKDLPPLRNKRKGEGPELESETKMRDLCVHGSSWAQAEEVFLKHARIILETPQPIHYEMDTA